MEASHGFVWIPTDLEMWSSHEIGCSPRYTYKGPDRAEVELIRVEGAAGDPAAPPPQARDEIKLYVDGRCVGLDGDAPAPLCSIARARHASLLSQHCSIPCLLMSCRHPQVHLGR